MYDDLRQTVDDEFDFEDDLEADEDFPVAFEASEGNAPQNRLLGMTPGERAFLSIMLFLNVLVLGAALLVVTGRLQF